jgi:hypothetical protein
MITTSTFKPRKIVDEKRQHGEAHSKPCFCKTKMELQDDNKKRNAT